MLNAELIPDLVALAALLGLLDLFRRRHPESRVRQWLLGMIFVFIEGVARLFYVRSGPLHIPTHILALDAYVIAGTIFVYSARRTTYPLWSQSLIYGLNVLPILVIETLYGMEYTQPEPYYACCAFALLVGAIMPFVASRRLAFHVGIYIAFRLLNWIPALILCSMGEYRIAAYWILAMLFLAAAVAMQQTLERHSVGKVAIVAGFALWAFCFAIHPFAAQDHFWAPIASHFWDLQKFLIIVGMVMVLLDEQIARNRDLALHDALTDLPNRRLLEDRLTQQIARAERQGTHIAVLMLDLNGFKQVNDSMGHAAGDEMLKMVADRLRSAVRAADTLARLGGDEFVIAIGDLSQSDSIDRIYTSIDLAASGQYQLQGREFLVELSIGAAVFPKDGRTMSDLLRVADDRMYRDKNRRNTASTSRANVLPIAR